MLHFKRFVVSVCFLSVLVLNHVHRTSGLIEDVLDIVHIGKEVISGVLQTWDIIEQTNLGDQIELPITREKQKKVLRRLRELSRQIEKSESKHVNIAAWTIESVNQYVKTNTQLELHLIKIHDIINSISTRFKQMNNYAKYRDKLENSTLLDFAGWTVSPHSEAVNHLLEKLFANYAGSQEQRSRQLGLLHLMADNLKDSSDQICVTKQSPQQFLFSLYNDITLTEIKGYAMMQFSWMILNIYGKGNYTQEAQLMRGDFEKRAVDTQKSVQEVMRRADRTLWTCDPDNHVEGVTYDEVTRLLQGYIENEVDMNPDSTCRENCGYYSEAKSHSCYKDLYCARQPRCNGKLVNCQYVDSDMWICPSSEKSNRRYEYIEYESGRVLGHASHCVRGSTKVDSWWRWLFWHCSYCFCLCDEQGSKSDRYFNLRESISNINENMVVTGLRFVKKNRVFHLQIQEGQLAPRGNINETSLTWKPVDEYKIFDKGVTPEVDYHTLTSSSRALDLDDLTTVDPMYVVTGVKFRIVGVHLNLEMRLTEFNFETGQLIEPSMTSHWISNDNTDLSNIKRTEIKLKSPDVSTRSEIKSLPTSKHNQYIEFVNTDSDKDAAQTTVPFVDIQDVVSNPPVPLSGVGIYHKGRDNYGGFVAPKVITYDFAPHIQSPKFTN